MMVKAWRSPCAGHYKGSLVLCVVSPLPAEADFLVRLFGHHYLSFRRGSSVAMHSMANPRVFRSFADGAGDCAASCCASASMAFFRAWAQAVAAIETGEGRPGR